MRHYSSNFRGNHWSTMLGSKEMRNIHRRLPIGRRSSLNLCYVEGYMLRCFFKWNTRQQHCTTRMKRISRNWLTDQSECIADVSLEQCNATVNYVYMKDGKDLIVRLSGKTGGQYFSNNQLLWNRESPNELPCIKREGEPARELDSHLLMSWSGDDIVTRCVESFSPFYG
ncbi:hypothetical protein Tcan_03872 [Toxocara canis]|uniref:Uncharacterized protein n=1 Tax=Toxocara canis TaxID=6265 RepID=A0A0B2V057_TOXCA|nr:hypothetical protein Tcan_03872 [Toxocara canis]